MRVILAVLALLLFGCGASLDPVHAGIATGALELQVESEPLIRGWRVEEMRAAAAEVHDRGGSREEAEHAVAARATAWQCAVDGHRLASTATGAYVDAVLLGGSGVEFSLEVVLRFLGPLVSAYRSLASCVESLGHALPVPAFLELIPPAWGVGDGDG